MGGQAGGWTKSEIIALVTLVVGIPAMIGGVIGVMECLKKRRGAQAVGKYLIC